MDLLSPTSRRTIAVSALAALVPLMLLSRLEAETQFNGTQRIEDIQYTPAPVTLPLLSFGYRQALADVLWASALVYFGEQLVLRGQMKYLAARTDSILALDPRFGQVYKWIGVVAVYNSSAITRGDIETSNRYLERGIKVFPRDGELYYLLAFNYGVELRPFAHDQAERDSFRRRSAELFLKAAMLPGTRADAALMAAEMSERGNDRTVAIAYVRALLAHAADDRIRDQLVRRLADLTSEAEAQAADADRRHFLESWRRDYPYVPVILFGLIGERFAPEPSGASLPTPTRAARVGVGVAGSPGEAAAGPDTDAGTEDAAAEGADPIP